MKIIDPHIHLFNLEQGDYHWLKSENPPFWPDKSTIKKTFTEQDLALEDDFQLSGFIHIEAGFDNVEPWREIAYLEKNCKLPFRSIAFIDFFLPADQFNKQLTKLLQFKSVVGCRYILDEHATNILTNSTVQKNLTTLAKHQLIFEVQMPLQDKLAIEALINISVTNPSLKLIINHAGLPALTTKIDNLWLSGLQRLSLLNNCAIKCSGWEMTDRYYSNVAVESILKHCLNFFGEQRVLLASNFPLCLLSKSYQAFWQSQQTMMTKLALTTNQQHLLTHKNAETWYQLSC